MKANSAVIAFPTDRPRPAAARRPGEGTAEIVIFPGVRIERMTDEPTAKEGPTMLPFPVAGRGEGVVQRAKCLKHPTR